jgi:transposase
MENLSRSKYNYSLFVDRLKSCIFAFVNQKRKKMNPTKRSKFESIGFDKSVWYKYYHQHQTSYIRTRLNCIKHFASGHNFADVAVHLGIGVQAVRNAVNNYITGGYAAVVAPIVRKQPTLLTAAQSASFLDTILNSHPTEHGFEANIWTAKVMIDYLKQTYNVTYKSGIYDFLDRLGLSHQRAHADYSNADSQAQAAFLRDFENTLYVEAPTTAIVFADEFSVCEKPTTYYGWAPRNTRPTVKTNEKKVNV